LVESNVVKITVDEVDPVAVAKTGVIVTLDPTGNYTILEEDVLVSKSDAGVGIESVTITPNSVNCADIGQKTITVTVTDSCGNQTEVTPQITVVEGTALLPPWVNANTAPAASGTATYSPCTANGTFKLKATGKSTTTNDVMHFVYDTIGTVATIIARLDDIDNGGYAGVMIRESLSPSAKTILFKTLLFNPNVYVGYRTTTGQAMRNLSQVVQLIHWMKIQRNGTTFKVFTLYNGTTWTQRYSGTIAMGSTAMAGIFTESVRTDRTSVAWFDNVSLWSSLKSGDEFAEAEIINLENEDSDVQIYPNPADEQVTVVLPNNDKPSTISFITMNGKTIKTLTISGSETNINVQDLKPGVYILRIENTENVVVKRLVIQ